MKALATFTACLVSTTIFAGTITVKDDTGAPLKDAKVFFVHPTKKVYKTAATDEKGVAAIEQSNNDAVTVFCVHEKYCAYRKEGFVPSQPLEIQMKTRAGAGSMVVAEKDAYVPGLKGRINPIRDTVGTGKKAKDRFYIYANNISIEGGKEQPYHFKLNKPINMEDADGNRFDVTVVDIVGSTSLVEFKRTK